MDLTGLLPVLSRDPGFAAALERVPGRGMLSITIPMGVRAPVGARAAEHRPIVIVTATTRAADEAAFALRS